MRPTVPLFALGSRVPAPAAPGIALAGPPTGRFFQAGPQWIHGVLVVDRADDPEEAQAWARALFVTSTDERGPLPFVRGLVGDRPLLGRPARDVELAGGRRAWAIPFQLDLSEHFGVARRKGAHFVHVGARTLRSPVLALRCDPGRPPDLAAEIFGEGGAPACPADQAVLAHALLRADRAAEAVRAFEAALADEALRADLDRGCLYQAACAAGRAALVAGDDAARDAYTEQALHWLEEDLERRRRLLQQRWLAEFHAEVAGGLAPARRAETDKLRAALVEHFRAAREDDPDLEVLRHRAVDDLFDLIPSPLPVPTPAAVAEAMSGPATPSGPAPTPGAHAPAAAPAPVATAAAPPAPPPQAAAPAAAAPAVAAPAEPAAAASPRPAGSPGREPGRMSTARRKAAEIRARVRARLDALEDKIGGEHGA